MRRRRRLSNLDTSNHSLIHEIKKLSNTALFEYSKINNVLTMPGGRTNPKNPIPFFVGNVPSKEEIVFDNPIFIPSKDRRPLLIFQGNIHR